MTAKRYRILTNRKRAVVALAHSVGFLGLAVATGGMPVRAWHAASPAAAWIMPGIYAVVTAALAALTGVGRDEERWYFGFCFVSAAFGLARQVAGDPPMHYAVYVRVAMLGCAVLVGMRIAGPSVAAPR